MSIFRNDSKLYLVVSVCVAKSGLLDDSIVKRKKKQKDNNNEDDDVTQYKCEKNEAKSCVCVWEYERITTTTKQP